MFERIAPEQHDTLEGIPEPSENPHLFGHGETAAMIAGMYRAGKLPHALLLSGPRGIGKATFAYHVAHHLLSYPTHRDAPEALASPDPATPLFRQMAMGAHPAILHLTRPFDDKGKKFKTVLTVEEIRRVSRFLSMTSHDGGYRVIIVDPADDMNTNAANALLKNLEEPPARTIFMLIAHSNGALLPTIRSRCQMIRLSPLDDANLAAALRGALAPQGGEATAQTALLARAGGSVRDAILLSEYGGLEIADALKSLVERANVAGAHKLAEVVAARGEDIRFDIFNENALDLLSEKASAAARAGGLAQARHLADAWQEARNAISDTDTYNLDRKQHALTMIERLNAAMRM